MGRPTHIYRLQCAMYIAQMLNSSCGVIKQILIVLFCAMVTVKIMTPSVKAYFFPQFYLQKIEHNQDQLRSHSFNHSTRIVNICGQTPSTARNKTRPPCPPFWESSCENMHNGIDYKKGENGSCALSGGAVRGVQGVNQPFNRQALNLAL